MKVKAVGDFFISSRFDGDTIVAHCGSKTEREVLEYIFDSGKTKEKALSLYQECFREGPPSTTTAIWINSKGRYDTILSGDPDAAIVRITKHGKLYESALYMHGNVSDHFAIGIAVRPEIREKMSDVVVTRYTTACELASLIGSEQVCLISE